MQVTWTDSFNDFTPHDLKQTWTNPRYQVSKVTKFCTVKIKQSLYSPEQALSVQEVETPRFHDSRHMKLVRLLALRTGHFCHQEIFLVLLSDRGGINPRAIVWQEGLCQWRIQKTPLGIQTATFRLVVQWNFFRVAPNICGSSEWNLLHFTLLRPRILRWLLDFRKICAFLVLSLQETSQQWQWKWDQLHTMWGSMINKHTDKMCQVQSL